MEQYSSIIQSKLQDLIQICIKERTDNGYGVLFLDFCVKESLDVRYVPLHFDIFPADLREHVVKRRDHLPNSVIIFYIYDNTMGEFLEIDLDKNSDFYKVKTKNVKASNNDATE